jgi:L-2-hydroxyglutarate oxidase LhgO
LEVEIVGLATAMAVGNKHPKASILVLEKEQDLAQHQTGRNSGVIHSGIYYKPGSLKARFAREGNRSMVEFCREHGIKHEVCGKVIVATKASELPLLQKIVHQFPIGHQRLRPDSGMRRNQVLGIYQQALCERIPELKSRRVSSDTS